MNTNQDTALTNNEKCDCLNYCGDDVRVLNKKVTPCNDYKISHVATVTEKRVYSGWYGSVKNGQIEITQVKGGNLKGVFVFRD